MPPERLLLSAAPLWQRTLLRGAPRRRESPEPNPPRGPRARQGLSRRAGARRGGSGHPRRRDPCAVRRERRGEIHLDQDPGRGSAPRELSGRNDPCRPALPLPKPARFLGRRHPHHLPGIGPGSRPERGRKRFPRPRIRRVPRIAAGTHAGRSRPALGPVGPRRVRSRRPRTNPYR